jgi:threonine dehydrogenase-like Zn-dependent dehydrogenase
VGSGTSIEAAVTATRPRGTVVLAGMPGQVTADLALAWQRELALRGAYGYSRDFPAAMELAQALRPGRLVAYGWPLQDYREALEQAPRAARGGRVRTVFDMREAA